MNSDTYRQNSSTFLAAKFIPTLLISFSDITTAENSGGWIGNNYNSYGEHNRLENGRTAWDALYNTTL
jgi:hypothetical protein